MNMSKEKKLFKLKGGGGIMYSHLYIIFLTVINFDATTQNNMNMLKEKKLFNLKGGG